MQMGQPYQAGQLDSGWHEKESEFRWSDARATLRLGAPGAAREIAIEVARPSEGGKRGPVTLVVRLNGLEAGRFEFAENTSMTAVATLPAGVDRTKPVSVEFLISPVLQEDGDGGRTLGLVFSRVAFR